MSTVGVCSHFRGGKSISFVRKFLFGALESVLCKEAISMEFPISVVSFVKRYVISMEFRPIKVVSFVKR